MPRGDFFSLSPFLRGESRGEGLYRQTRTRGWSPSPAARRARRPLPASGARLRTENLRRLRQRSLGLGESPVDPLRQERDVARFHRGAAPAPQAGRRVAVVREIVARAFLLHQGNQLLGKIRPRIPG